LTYHLGIDLGTTFTAAAVARPDGQVQMAGLGDHGTAVPSVLHLRADGQLLVGEPALRRATEEPDRVARESKRRVGDTTPLVLGGTPVSAELLQGRLARWVVDRVGEREGAWPTSITVTHPASWGAYKLDLLRGALRQVDLGDARLLPEPVAAATAYAAERDLGPGTRIAVYDLGGGTFDACVLQRADNGRHFEVVGSPEGIDRLGGIDFDEAIFSHVRASLGDALEGLDADDPASRAALIHLRRECVAAKHALSADSDASIAVLLPTVRTGVRLTRSEFEDMIRPALAETVVALRRSIRSAGVEAADLASVLLVGGSSRIPLVSQLVATELGRPVVVDAHPKDAIALGAAITGRDGATAAASPDWQLPHPTVPAAVVAPAAPPPGGAPDPVPATTAEVGDVPAPVPLTPDGKRRPTLLLAAAAVAVIVALAAGAFASSAATTATPSPVIGLGSPGRPPTRPPPATTPPRPGAARTLALPRRTPCGSSTTTPPRRRQHGRRCARTTPTSAWPSRGMPRRDAPVSSTTRATPASPTRTSPGTTTTSTIPPSKLPGTR
jgi:actin-like ATPase involved in cell morphogenesis